MNKNEFVLRVQNFKENQNVKYDLKGILKALNLEVLEEVNL